MDGSRKRTDGRRLSAAGLIVITAATLLMLLWAMFPTAAFALGISVNPGSLTSHGCNANEWHFVINQIQDQDEPPNGNDDEKPASIHVTWANGASADIPLGAPFEANIAHYTTTANLNSTVTGATATIYDGWSGQFNLSHGPCGTPSTTTQTTTSSTSSTTTETTTEPSTTTSSTSSTSSTTTATTTEPSTTTETTTSTSSTTTEPSTTTSSTSSTSTSSTSPPTTSTSSSSTSVAPTTITPTESTSPPDTTEVNPTTVSPPRGTAFTGVEDVIPLGVIALGLMTAGSGLLWAGTRRARRNEDG